MTLYRLILQRDDGSEFESAHTSGPGCGPLTLEEILELIGIYHKENWRLVEA